MLTSSQKLLGRDGPDDQASQRTPIATTTTSTTIGTHQHATHT
jgi:hypothetical protein